MKVSNKYWRINNNLRNLTFGLVKLKDSWQSLLNSQDLQNYVMSSFYLLQGFITDVTYGNWFEEYKTSDYCFILWIRELGFITVDKDKRTRALVRTGRHPNASWWIYHLTQLVVPLQIFFSRLHKLYFNSPFYLVSVSSFVTNHYIVIVI